jgi:hypothetical protein
MRLFFVFGAIGTTRCEDRAETHVASRLPAAYRWRLNGNETEAPMFRSAIVCAFLTMTACVADDLSSTEQELGPIDDGAGCIDGN